MGNTTLVESPTHCFCCQAIRGETFGYIWGAKLCQAAVGCPPGWFAVCKHASTVSFSKKFLEWIQLTVDVDGEDGAWSVPLRTMDLWVSNVASLFLIPWIFFMENSMEFPGKFVSDQLFEQKSGKSSRFELVELIQVTDVFTDRERCHLGLEWETPRGIAPKQDPNQIIIQKTYHLLYEYAIHPSNTCNFLV